MYVIDTTPLTTLVGNTISCVFVIIAWIPNICVFDIWIVLLVINTHIFGELRRRLLLRISINPLTLDNLNTIEINTN